MTKGEETRLMELIEEMAKQLTALKADIKGLKMNMLQINQLKVRMGERV
jgi:hypothetical protein